MSTHAAQRSERDSGTNAFAAAIDTDRIVNCPFSMAIDGADLLLPMIDYQTLRVRLPLRQIGLPFDGALTHNVKSHLRRQADRTERGRSHDQVDFDWCAESRWLPNLRGVLRFRIAAVSTRIILHADYVPPFGRLGSLFDRAIGHRLAHATASDLVDRFAIALQTRWAQELKRFPNDRSTVEPRAL